jgi:hypothetical protein
MQYSVWATLASKAQVDHMLTKSTMEMDHLPELQMKHKQHICAAYIQSQ